MTGYAEHDAQGFFRRSVFEVSNADMWRFAAFCEAEAELFMASIKKG
jgi:hypothetical protein